MKTIELLWFDGCPNHAGARALVEDVVGAMGIEVRIETIEVPDEETAARVRFPGSPTIRVDGRDIEPGYEECEDCTPRCRVYATSSGLRGLPERLWLEQALSASPGGGV